MILLVLESFSAFFSLCSPKPFYFGFHNSVQICLQFCSYGQQSWLALSYFKATEPATESYSMSGCYTIRQQNGLDTQNSQNIQHAIPISEKYWQLELQKLCQSTLFVDCIRTDSTKVTIFPPPIRVSYSKAKSLALFLELRYLSFCHQAVYDEP